MTNGWLYTTSFQNTAGLKAHAPVTVPGILVGRVESIDYDTAAYEAVIRTYSDVRYDDFPADTAASIYTAACRAAEVWSQPLNRV